MAKKGQGLCSKASASKSEAVREVFPSPNPALRGFPVAEFGAGGFFSGKTWPRRVFQWQIIALEGFPVAKSGVGRFKASRSEPTGRPKLTFVPPKGSRLEGKIDILVDLGHL